MTAVLVRYLSVWSVETTYSRGDVWKAYEYSKDLWPSASFEFRAPSIRDSQHRLTHFAPID